jgi:hypothetical protein
MVSTPQASARDRVIVYLGAEVGISYFEQSLFAKLQRRHDEGARLPGIAGIRNDLLSISGPVPARVSRGKQGQDDYLRLYIKGRYALVLNVSKYNQGYIIGDAYPLGLRDHDDIVRDGFGLTATRWHLYDHPRELPRHLDAQWPSVKEAWRSRPKSDGTATERELPVNQRDYLDDLQRLIDKAREIELNGTSPDRVCRYRRITPAAAQRRSTQSIYKFQLMGDSQLTAGSKVHIDEHPDLRGEITLVRGSLITVRFDQPVDFNRIPSLGAFAASPNTTSLDKQAEAVHILREQRAQNPTLLDALVDHRFQRFTVATAKPREPLDPSQEAAFRKALAVPDLALVQGPPGTGKTRTIKQVVWECTTGAVRSGTVLVSAYTNQAVDNVLKGLPETLTVVRVGSGVTADCEHLTLEAQASDLQKRILDRTEAVLSRYAKADPDGGAWANWKEIAPSLTRPVPRRSSRRTSSEAGRRRSRRRSGRGLTSLTPRS